MPHLQIDYSVEIEARLDPDSFLRTLVDEFCKIRTIDPAAVKGYARCAEYFASGHQAPEGFVHLTVCLLEGRQPEVLEEISDRLYKTGQQALKGNLPHPVSWTLEIREMDAPTYRKGTVG